MYAKSRFLFSARMSMILGVSVVTATLIPNAQAQSVSAATGVSKKAASAPNPTASILLFTPPAPNGDEQSVLSALRYAGEEYKAYEVSNSQSEIQVREISVSVINDLKTFQTLVVSGGSGVLTRTPVDDSARSQISSTILNSTKTYLSKKCKVTAQADMKVMIMIYGGNGTFFDSNQRPSGTMQVRLLLLDTKEQRVLWYSERPWGLGQNTKQASDSAAINIISQLDKLFGSSNKPN
jgi:hypothetical protein